jgi:hypothetical protein
MAEQIMVKNVMLGFPALAEPQSLGDGEPAYSVKLPIQPGSENEKLIEAAIVAVAEEQWNDRAAAVLSMLKEDGKICYTKKVYRSKSTGEAYDGFDNHYYLSARNAKTQPTVFNEYGEQLSKISDIERQAYSGAIAKGVSLEIWAQDNKWGKRINCTLRGVMLSGEGERKSGGSAPASADEFAGLAASKPSAEDTMGAEDFV